MKLVAIDTGPKGQTGAHVGDDVLNFAAAAPEIASAAAIPADMIDLLETGDDGIEAARGVVGAVEDAGDAVKDRLREQGALTPYVDTHLLAPIPRPSILMSSGRNYRSHIEEMAERTGEPPNYMPNPTARLVNPRGVIGHNAAIVLPPQNPNMVDWEVEFTIVFGKKFHNIGEDEALDTIAGYTLYNDVGARDWNPTARDPETGAMDWTFIHLGKNMPTFGPLGPCIATKDEIPDPDKTRIKTIINGETMQDTLTDDLCFTIAKTISYFSHWYEFHPGDLFATGSPPGVGYAMDPQRFLRDGDICELWGEGIGTLSNPVVKG